MKKTVCFAFIFIIVIGLMGCGKNDSFPLPDDAIVFGQKSFHDAAHDSDYICYEYNGLWTLM